MVFYTKVLGISGGMVGTLFLVTLICGCIHGCDDGTHRRRSAAGAGWKVPLLDPQDVRTGGVVEFLMYQTAMAQASMPWKIVYMYVTYLFWGSIFYTSINIPYGSMASAITTEASERTALSTSRSIGATLAGLVIGIVTPLFSVHDRCRRQSGRARQRNIYGGCGHFLDSRVTLLSGLLPHDYGTGGGGA